MNKIVDKIMALAHDFRSATDWAEICTTSEALRAALVSALDQGEPVFADNELPPKYMLAKLQMVMPLFQEARDALTAITLASAKLHGVDLSLGDRMDAAGTYSLDDWVAGRKP